jgi:hypothetical protein
MFPSNFLFLFQLRHRCCPRIMPLVTRSRPYTSVTKEAQQHSVAHTSDRIRLFVEEHRIR